ncbi:hypothetical protein DITRI_Ditri02bG0132000 [Diplodiscus trichospermus]
MELESWNMGGIDYTTKEFSWNLSEIEQLGYMEWRNNETLELMGCMEECNMTLNYQVDEGNTTNNQWALQIANCINDASGLR